MKSEHDQSRALVDAALRERNFSDVILVEERGRLYDHLSLLRSSNQIYNSKDG